MTTRLLIVFSLVALITAVTLIVVQHQTGWRLREEISSLERKTSELKWLQMENEQLSNLVTQPTRLRSLQPEQSRELLRLRSEAGRLKRENRQIRTVIGNPDNISDAEASSGSDTPKEHPKESWKFAGRSTPEAALESFYWAISNGYSANLRASMLTEGRTSLQDGSKEEQDRESNVNAAAVFITQFNQLKGYHILSRDTVSESEVSFEVAYSGMAGAMRHRLKKVGDDWKMVSEE